jgi:hypothetical protein
MKRLSLLLSCVLLLGLSSLGRAHAGKGSLGIEPALGGILSAQPHEHKGKGLPLGGIILPCASCPAEAPSSLAPEHWLGLADLPQLPALEPRRQSQRLLGGILPGAPFPGPEAAPIQISTNPMRALPSGLPILWSIRPPPTLA